MQYIWHPCSQMKDYENFPPVIIERGEGAYLYDIEGKSYLDAVSSWWVNIFGHSNKRLNEALRKQSENLEHVIFANFSHKPAIEIAERIVDITPVGLQKVFFSDNGSSAVEVSLKLSFQYHQQKGNINKTRFVSITGAYHGETLGALSVGDIDIYSEIYNPIMVNTYRVKGPDCYRCELGKQRGECNSECFANMENFLEENNEKICGIIIEPLIQGAAGMKIYPPCYIKKLRDICTRYDIHFIADEIAVGFGRTGKMFACEHAEITPDIMCLSKGLTAGYLPMALTVTTDEIYNAFYADYTERKAFMHSHSYNGNPLACSVAIESLNIFRDEAILEKNIDKAKLICNIANEQFKNQKYVGEYRQIGMVSAIELVENKATKKGFDWAKRVGYNIYKIALKHGVLLRPLGNVIYFMPPYVIEEKDIELMISVAKKSINEYFREI